MATDWTEDTGEGIGEKELLEKNFFIWGYTEGVENPWEEGETLTEVEVSLEEDGDKRSWRTASSVILEQLGKKFQKMDAEGWELPFRASLKKKKGKDTGRSYSRLVPPLEEVPF